MNTATTSDKTDLIIDHEADAIIRKYMLWALGAGLVPVPWLDMAAIAGVQLKMLSELAAKYSQSFSDEKAKVAIGTLVGSVVPGQMASGFVGGLVKMIPFVGMVAVPAFAGASTYALGKVFEQHFASGGTFLNFDAAAVRQHFAELYAKGKTAASDIANEASPAEASQTKN
ncbi:MAG: DUF697 domain-containing protein [Acidobacteria bacterium]|nr:DUF697 domain-containing protein [Acidobacteriota bacterium]